MKAVHRDGLLGATCGLALLGMGLSGLSCVTTPPVESCEQACSVASRCGLLPSALGGSVEERRDHNEQSCVAHCIASEADDPQVAGLLALLGEQNGLPDDALCNQEGTRACEELIAELESDPDTSELEVTTSLTIRMVNLVSHVTSESLGSWCCFDHRYDIDGLGNDVDELAEAYEILDSTYACIDQLQEAAEIAGGNPAVVAEQCTAIQEQWSGMRAPTMLGAPPEPLEPDLCSYARRSKQLQGFDIPTIPEDCEGVDAPYFGALGEQLGRLEMGWNLEADGVLLDENGNLRGQEDIRARLQSGIHDRLAHPGAPLDKACVELIGTIDASGCEALDREMLAEPTPCEGGPACSQAECLEELPACDTTLCDVDRSPPGRDCGELGITEVRLGYRDDRGLEVLGDPIQGCETLTEVVTTFEHVNVGSLVPVAVVTGTLPTFHSHDGSTGSFSWVVIGEAQWVTAGAAELEVPSPLVEWAENQLENPLEALGWVSRRVPTGKACDLEPAQCEGYFSNNCENGIDDDSNGLIDEDDAWCDELMRFLVERCVVAEPGREFAEGCHTPAPP